MDIHQLHVKLRQRVDSLMSDSRNPSEATTISYLIQPVLEHLGWFDPPNNVSEREKMAVSGKKPDFTLSQNGFHIFCIEAKALKEDLDKPKWGAQATGYSSDMKVRWVVLTNGYRWVLYDCEKVSQQTLDQMKVWDVTLNNPMWPECIQKLAPEVLSESAPKVRVQMDTTRPQTKSLKALQDESYASQSKSSSSVDPRLVAGAVIGTTVVAAGFWAWMDSIEYSTPDSQDEVDLEKFEMLKKIASAYPDIISACKFSSDYGLDDMIEQIANLLPPQVQMLRNCNATYNSTLRKARWALTPFTASSLIGWLALIIGVLYISFNDNELPQSYIWGFIAAAGGWFLWALAMLFASGRGSNDDEVRYALVVRNTQQQKVDMLRQLTKIQSKFEMGNHWRHFKGAAVEALLSGLTGNSKKDE